MRKCPPVLWVGAVGFLLKVAFGLAFQSGDAPLRIKIAAVIVLAVPVFFTLRGSRVAWSLLAALMLVGVIGVFASGAWWNGLIRAVLLALVLAPASIRFAWKPATAGPAA